MGISEMHVWFRQYAQQMGMQNVRAILPEQIDNLINTATIDTVNEVINYSIGSTNDRVITDNSKLANINALRTLYKVKTIPATTDDKISAFKNVPYVFTSAALGDNILYFVDFSINYATNTESINDKRATYNASLSTYIEKRDRAHIAPTTENLDALDDARDNLIANEALLNTALANAVDLSRLFPIRIIEDSKLADVLNDWILSPRMRTPAMVVYASDADDVDSKFELYLGENEEDGVSAIAAQKSIAGIRCSYIKRPAKVRYLSDVGGTNIDSDLPEQLQIPMLKHAVDLYRTSIQGSLYSAQQQAQAQQREDTRNTARPTNDGYQS